MIKFTLVFFVFIASLTAEEKLHRIVFVTGQNNEIPGEREYWAGARFLADQLNASSLPVKASVLEGDVDFQHEQLKEADALVVYSGGFGEHILNRQFMNLDKWLKGGKSIAFLHTACQVFGAAKSGLMQSWVGAYYDKYMSTDPEWQCRSILNKKSPLTRGVKEFAVRDRWLFNLNFFKGHKKEVIMSGIPDESARSGKYTTLKLPIKSVQENKGREEPVLWTSETLSGGRSFVFTGGHYHDTWRNKNMRKLILNGLVWLVGCEVPERGVKTSAITDAEFRAHLSDGNVDEVWQKERAWLAQANLKFSSQVITDKTPKKSVAIELDVENKSELSLVVLDGGDGINCDHAVWASPVFKGTKDTVSLLKIKWEQALTGWRRILINQSLHGDDLKLNGKEVKGIATHSVSVIRYKIPVGMKKFTVTAGLSDSREGGSVQFQVYVK